MDARALILPALLVFSCAQETDVGPGLIFRCHANTILLERHNGADEDFAVWEVDIETGKRNVRCNASRGGWVCPDPNFDGRPAADTPSLGGLPKSSRILVQAPAEEPFSEWRVAVTRNGLIVVPSRKPDCGPHVCDVGAARGVIAITTPQGTK